MSVRFSIAVPAAWHAWDPDPRTRLASIRRAVDERVAGDPVLAPYRDRLVEILVGFGKTADERGAVAAATLWERSDFAPLAANVMFFFGERSKNEDVNAILARLARPAPDDLRARDVEVVDLPAGPAVRLALLTQTSDEPGDLSVVLEAVQYWVPLPDRPEVLLLSASTPCLDRAEELTATFDQIAASLKFEATPASPPGRRDPCRGRPPRL